MFHIQQAQLDLNKSHSFYHIRVFEIYHSSENEHQFYERANIKTNGPKPYEIFQN